MRKKSARGVLETYEAYRVNSLPRRRRRDTTGASRTMATADEFFAHPV